MCVFYRLHNRNRDPPESKMAKQLLQLPDDCLTDIFENLCIVELADVASTCTRFRTIARQVFSLWQNRHCLTIDMDTFADSPFHLRQIPAILRNFGDLLTKLNVSFRYTDQRVSDRIRTLVFNCLVTYCTEPLDRLQLTGCRNFHLDKINNATRLFRKVRELYLSDSDAINIACLTDLWRLIKLTIDRPPTIKYLSIDYPVLKSFTLTRALGDEVLTDHSAVGEFLERHDQLTEIEIDTTDYCDLTQIGSMPVLRKLSIQDPYSIKIEENIMPLTNLSKLTTLTLYVDGDEQMPAFLKSLKSKHSLVELDLWSECWSGDELEFMKALSRYTRLRKLYFSVDTLAGNLLLNLHGLKNLRTLSMRHLRVMITSDDLVNLIRQLPHLVELILLPLDTMDVRLRRTTYLRICEIYRSRSAKLVICNFERTKQTIGVGNCRQPFGDDCNQQDLVKYIYMEDSRMNNIYYI